MGVIRLVASKRCLNSLLKSSQSTFLELYVVSSFMRVIARFNLISMGKRSILMPHLDVRVSQTVISCMNCSEMNI